MKSPENFRLHSVLVLAAIPLILYLPTLNFSLLDGWDDDLLITQNEEYLRFTIDNICHWFTTAHVNNYYPLTMFSYMLDHALGGTHALSYRIQNLFWFVLSLIGIFRCMTLLGIRHTVALACVLIFAVHPQRVESVAWVAERKDVLSGAFYFWGLSFFVARLQKGRSGFPIAAFVCFCAAILSKAMAVSMPIVLLLYLWHHRMRTSAAAPGRRDLLQLLPFFAVSAVMIPVTIAAQGSAIDLQLGMARRIGVGLHSYYWYTAETILPTGVCPLYPRVNFGGVELVKMFLFYGVICWILLVLLRRYGASFFRSSVLPWPLAYVVIVAPIAGFVPLGAIDHADRYSFYPAAFIMAMIGIMISKACHSAQPSGRPPAGAPMSRRDALLPKLRILAVVFAACYGIALTIQTVDYFVCWRDLYSVMSCSAERSRPNPVAVGTLAELELGRGDYGQVLRLAAQLESLEGGGLTEAHVKANGLKAIYLRAATFHRMGRHPEALLQFSELRPYLGAASLGEAMNISTAYSMMGSSQLAVGDYAGAVDTFTELMSVTKDHFEGYVNRGAARLALEQYAAAAADFVQAVRLRPGDLGATKNLEHARAKVTSGGHLPGQRPE